MGFLSVALNLPKVIVISFLIDMLSQLKLVVRMAFTRMGLLKRPQVEEEEEEDSSWDSSNNYVLILDSSSPSLVPISVHLVTSFIKKRLPVVRYSDYRGRGVHLLHEEEEEEEEDKAMSTSPCAVCLESLESDHEIRELCNCSHVFHRLCLDTWVDEGQITCPMCRSMLLPPNVNLNLLRAAHGGGGSGEEDRVR